MKLLIVRHADPDYSIDSLTEVGWLEAELLAKRLSKLDIKAFYVSPLGRARDTASLTLKQLGREAQVCPWLREFGNPIRKPYETENSVCWDWIPEAWTEETHFHSMDTWYLDSAFCQGEAKAQYDWVTRELDKLLASHGYVRQGNRYHTEQGNEDTIVFFCHFGVEAVLLSHLLNISPMLLWHGTCAAPSSVTTLITEERRKGEVYFRMGCFGDTAHLYVADREPSFSARFCETFESDQRHD